MVALTRHDIFLLQLAVDRAISETRAKLRAAKRIDASDQQTQTLTDMAAHLESVKQKLIQMRG